MRDIYPWDLLFDGEPHVLRRIRPARTGLAVADGTGFGGDTERFRKTVIATAHRRGMLVTTAVNRRDETIRVTAIGHRKSPQARRAHLATAARSLHSAWEAGAGEEALTLMRQCEELAAK